jgi:hypothetical protein
MLKVKKKRMIFSAMETYFNQAFEAFFVQTNGLEPMPTVTELAALYFDVNEVEAAMYLLGAAQGGLECVLDRELCVNELMYHGPMLKLKECQENTEWLKLCSERVAEIRVKKQAQLIIPVQKKKINIKEENHLKEEKMVVI